MWYKSTNRNKKFFGNVIKNVSMKYNIDWTVIKNKKNSYKEEEEWLYRKYIIIRLFKNLTIISDKFM